MTSRPKILCHRPCAPCTKFSNESFEYLNTWWKTHKKIVRYVISRFFAICHFVKSRKNGKIYQLNLCQKKPKYTLPFMYTLIENCPMGLPLMYFGQKIISDYPDRSFGGHFWCPDDNQKRNRYGNLGKLIDLSSVSTHYGHCMYELGII